MRTAEEVRRVQELVAAGVNDCEIERCTGIPRRTVLDWRHGRVPNFAGRRVYPIGQDPELEPAVEPYYPYLLGLYLGDGCISDHPRGVFRLRITLDGIYPNIVAECKAAMAAVMPKSRVGLTQTPSRAVEVGSYSKAWPQIFPQHGRGRKHERRIFLAPWQSEICARRPEGLIRGLIHSDGCRSTNWTTARGRRYEYPRYSFCNTSDDIRAIFCEHLDLLGIAWRRMNALNISVARREAVARLDEFVGPKT